VQDHNEGPGESPGPSSFAQHRCRDQVPLRGRLDGGTMPFMRMYVTMLP